MDPILEIGCAYGDASAYLASAYGLVAYGLDQNQVSIEEAKRRHREMVYAKKLHFLHGDAETLPFPPEHFAGAVMEASFSPLIDKTASSNALFRVLKRGGRILLNDFATRESIRTSEARCSNVPCFQGVETMEEYRERFESAGFTTIHMKEEHGELVHVALWLAKSLKVPLSDIEKILSVPSSAEDGLAENSPDRNSKNKLKLTYCQMVFEKE